ncbi:hypothetical protein DL771_005723 [Monosporascus sp. 5C6A]|nr:hypothetical protein DL771_005723 [Monosporascus sp. 5C6A]
MADKKRNPGQLPVEQSNPSDKSFVLMKDRKQTESHTVPSPQPGPSYDRGVPQDAEFYSEEEKEQEPITGVAAGKRPAFGASSEEDDPRLPQQSLEEDRLRTPVQQ